MLKLHHIIKKPKLLGFFCNFQVIAQSKYSPIGRKFAQSGHPVDRVVDKKRITRKNGGLRRRRGTRSF
jgi:hypothetical protein